VGVPLAEKLLLSVPLVEAEGDTVYVSVSESRATELVELMVGDFFVGDAVIVVVTPRETVRDSSSSETEGVSSKVEVAVGSPVTERVEE
jgi:uncharacterized membrane protein